MEETDVSGQVTQQLIDLVWEQYQRERAPRKGKNSGNNGKAQEGPAVPMILEEVGNKDLAAVIYSETKPTRAYMKPPHLSRNDWWEKSIREFKEWQERPRISDGTTCKRFDDLRKSSKARMRVPIWADDDDALLIFILGKHPEYTTDEAQHAKGVRIFELVNVCWRGGDPIEDSPLVGMKDGAIRAHLHRIRRQGSEMLLSGGDNSLWESLHIKWTIYGQKIDIFRPTSIIKLSEMVRSHGLVGELRRDPSSAKRDPNLIKILALLPFHGISDPERILALINHLLT